MANPRVFVSSTYYDLKHLRSSLENFIETIGYEPVLSEKGDISYSPDIPLDESCYREVRNADIFILIIGGRYGSEASSENKKPNRDFFEKYESITKQEYTNAVSRDIPSYIMIENNVYSEYQTFLKNKENEKIHYAHVDSVNIFYLIEDILSKPRNNPIQTFERFSDIKKWLREQWAGLFKELLQRLSSQNQISSISTQVSELKEINITLKRYLESVVSKISPDESQQLIQDEDERLEEVKKFKNLLENPLVRFLNEDYGIETPVIHSAISTGKSFSDIVDKLSSDSEDDNLREELQKLMLNIDAKKDINNAREALGSKPFLIRRRISMKPKKA